MQAKEAIGTRVEYPRFKKFTTLRDALIYMVLKGNKTVIAEFEEAQGLPGPYLPNTPQRLDRKCEFL
jgi:hypothetical protein